MLTTTRHKVRQKVNPGQQQLIGKITGKTAGNRENLHPMAGGRRDGGFLCRRANDARTIVRSSIIRT